MAPVPGQRLKNFASEVERRVYCSCQRSCSLDPCRNALLKLV